MFKYIFKFFKLIIIPVASILAFQLPWLGSYSMRATTSFAFGLILAQNTFPFSHFEEFLFVLLEPFSWFEINRTIKYLEVEKTNSFRDYLTVQIERVPGAVFGSHCPIQLKYSFNNEHTVRCKFQLRYFFIHLFEWTVFVICTWPLSHWFK